MQISSEYDKEYRDHIRKRVQLQRRMDRDLEKTIESYRAWYSSQRAQGFEPVTIVAEGDSWFRYVVGRAVVWQLEKKMKVEILNLAQPGDEACEMLTGKQRKKLERILRQGPAARKKYDFLLFSGGGNDLVGKDTFHKWLHPYENGMSAEDVLNEVTLGKALALLDVHYRELIEIRNARSRKTHLVFHGYDFAYPNGKGVCWLGPWLEPGLKLRKVPTKKLRREVVALFLKRFNDFLLSLSTEYERIVVVPTQGTLETEDEWANELHPKNPGFAKIADRFKQTIESV